MQIIANIKSAPVSIKLFLALFIVYDTFNFIYCLIAKDITLQFVAITSVQLVLLYGVLNKIAWSRGILVGLYIFLIPLLMALLATSIINTHYISLFASIIIVNLLPLGALLLLYTQQSDMWFNQIRSQKEESAKIIWPAQLSIIIASVVLGFIALLIESKLNIPLIKAEQLSHVSSMTVKLTIFHLNQTFGLLCAWVMLLVPVGFFLALWKNYNLILLTRLMMIGFSLSLIFRDLTMKNADATLYYSSITLFFVHLFLASYLVYFSVSSGRKVKNMCHKISTCKKDLQWK